MTSVSTKKANHCQIFQNDIGQYNNCLTEYRQFFEKTITTFENLDKKVIENLKGHCMRFYVVNISSMKNIEYDISKTVKDLEEAKPTFNDYQKVNATFNVSFPSTSILNSK